MALAFSVYVCILAFAERRKQSIASHQATGGGLCFTQPYNMGTEVSIADVPRTVHQDTLNSLLRTARVPRGPDPGGHEVTWSRLHVDAIEPPPPLRNTMGDNEARPARTRDQH